MSGKARKYLASSLNGVELPEIYPLNRWMNIPFVRSHLIEEFFPYVERHIIFEYHFTECEVTNIYYFTEGNSKGIISYCPFEKTKSARRFFNLSLPETGEDNFTEINSIVDQSGNDLLLNPTQVSELKRNLFKSPDIISINDDDLSLNSNKAGKSTRRIKIDPQIPDIIEVTSYFKPEIEEIKLLTPLSAIDKADSEEVMKSETIIKQPVLSTLQNLDIAHDFPMLEYHNFSIGKTTAYSLSNEHFAGSVSIVETDTADTTKINNKNIYRLLEPVYELSEELKNEILINLPSYQKVGAKFLFNSNFALLNDQFELGKELQAVLALKMLLRVRAVKKVLVVTNSFKETVESFFAGEKLKGIWQSNLNLFLPDFAYKYYNNYKDLKGKNLISEGIIHCLSYELLEECSIKGDLSADFFSQFDTVILDDFVGEALGLESIRSLNRNVTFEYFWFLSDYDNPALINSIQNILPEKALKCLGRYKDSVCKGLNKRYNFDFYLELDEENKSICEDVYKKGIEKLDDVIGLGNILRFRPNIFQIYHDEQRALNFAADTGRSNKTDLLLYHVKQILNREDRVLVYSQFEGSGINQISDLLNKNNIETISFAQSDSPADLEKKIQLLENFEKKIVLLSNLKPNGIKFIFPGVSHLINFDNWWNPATRWHLETKLQEKENNKCITVYNYYYCDTIEGRVQMELDHKGLKEKAILDSLTTEHFYKIYDENDWCELFDIKSELFGKPAPEEFALSNMKDLVENAKKLLIKLGYKYIDTSASIKDCSFAVQGKLHADDEYYTVSARCFYSEHLSSQFINNLLKALVENYQEEKIFIIASGTISRPNIVLPDNICLISGERLKKYIEVL